MQPHCCDSADGHRGSDVRGQQGECAVQGRDEVVPHCAGFDPPAQQSGTVVPGDKHVVAWVSAGRMRAAATAACRRLLAATFAAGIPYA